MLSFTIGRSSIAVFFDGKFYSIDDSHANHPLLLEQLRLPPAERDLDAVRDFLTIKTMIARLTVGRVSITDTEVLFEGTAIGNYMAERMLELMNDGIDIEPYAAFMNNVMDNPADYIHDELYQWMEKAKMPITPDGCFIAFKKVRADYTDCYTGMFDNSPGSIVEMDRALCNTNRNETCSSGLHFCSADYLGSFGGQRVVILKIDPKHITSIPVDYKYTKGRTCRYEVVAELTKESAAYDSAWKRGVINLEDPSEFPAHVLSAFVLPAPALNEPADNPGLLKATEVVVTTRAGKYDPLGTTLKVSSADDLSGLSPTQRLDIANEAVAKAGDAPAGALVSQAVVNVAVPNNDDKTMGDLANEAAFARFEAEQTDALPTNPAEITEEQINRIADNGPDGPKMADGLRADREKALMDQRTFVEEMRFETSDKRSFSATVIEQVMKDASIRGAARDLGIGESTLRGWLKKMKEAQPRP
jgi:hypothetical protein